MAWVQQLLYYTLFKWHRWIKNQIKTLAQVPDINRSHTNMKRINEVRCLKWKYIEESKKAGSPRSQTQDTLGLSRQCFATKPQQLDDHQPSPFSIRTAEVVLKYLDWTPEHLNLFSFQREARCSEYNEDIWIIRMQCTWKRYFQSQWCPSWKGSTVLVLKKDAASCAWVSSQYWTFFYTQLGQSL